MSELNNNEQMLDMYLFETNQNIEQLENCILETEKSKEYSQDSINEIFRIMHTIKGSSAMMLFNVIAELAHGMEDLFFYIREQKPEKIDTESLSDLLLEGVDFIKVELEKIKEHDLEENDNSALNSKIKAFLFNLKNQNQENNGSENPASQEKVQYYILPDKPAKQSGKNCFKAVVFFEDGCEMENIRAFTIVHKLKEFTKDITYKPDTILEDENSSQIIRKQGFELFFRAGKTYQEMEDFLKDTIFLKSFELLQMKEDEEFQQLLGAKEKQAAGGKQAALDNKVHTQAEHDKASHIYGATQNIISVNIAKLDQLMDLVGEMVISEAMVTQNPDLSGLQDIDNFQKAARQHHKIICEVQDLVMSIRMVPLAATFHKMHRLIRDMNKSLHKEAELVLIGEETEVDKNIIEHISDPLMHLVRNCVDHGIETPEEREARGKNKAGIVVIEAKNAGSEVLIQIKDDGRGLNRDKILNKAKEHGLLRKPENEMTDKEIFNMILLPGFSTRDKVSEYSGRGVGMDVVMRNIEEIGGNISIDSVQDKGTCITLKIPLTLAIIDGMNIRVGESRYTIPITAIKESFQPSASDIIKDPDENEMIMVRGNCYHIKRLHRIYKVKTEVTEFTQGILIMVEQDERICCLFADELLGQQQVVVKALPDYIKNMKKIQGITGCTLLGDGNISLILDIAGIAG